MQAENLQEYTFIREEMIKLKDCVTSYMGFVLGGSALAIFGLASIEPVKSNVMTYFSLILSLIFSMVLLILLYKFNSHNRYAGYSMLLNQERHDKKQTDMNNQTQLIAWELCIERLRRSDIKPKQLTLLVTKIKTEMDAETLKDLAWIINKYTGPKPPIDRRKRLKGAYHLILSLLGRVKTNSWAFPSFVVSMFFILVFAFILSGIYGLVIFSLDAKSISRELVVLWVVSAVILTMQGYLWLTFCGKLYTLMTGSATVDGFFWRFMPIRAAYLNEYHIKPTYVLAKERLAEIRADSDPTDDAPTE